MQFKVTPQTGTSFILSDEKLYEQLMMAIVDKKKESNNEMIFKGGENITSLLANWLSVTGYIFQYSLISSLYMAFKLGWYYHSFITKQKVEIILEHLEQEQTIQNNNANNNKE